MICRIKFGETEAGKFLSHLDMLRAWQRAISRSQLPLSYSQGYNKHPKLSFSSALPVGLTSKSEYVDIEFDEDLPLDEISAALKTNLPPALEIYALKELTKNDAAIMNIVERAAYQAVLELNRAIEENELDEIISSILEQETIEVSRRKKNSRTEKTMDIRPWLYTLEAEISDSLLILDFIVQNGNSGNVKPQEIIALVTEKLTDCEIVNISRKELYALKDGQMITPMEV